MNKDEEKRFKDKDKEKRFHEEMDKLLDNDEKISTILDICAVLFDDPKYKVIKYDKDLHELLLKTMNEITEDLHNGKEPKLNNDDIKQIVNVMEQMVRIIKDIINKKNIAKK